MAIPRADREVLRMQARSGRQGIAAYEDAKKELTRGRGAAIRQAMHEAALRGAPAGAIASLRPEIVSPYNQGIRNLTHEGALYEQDLASRTRRMADYNRAVLSARHLIGDEVQQAVAPIRAQGRFDVAQINAQSAGRVAELEAQARLTEAQMRAAEAEANRSGGGSGESLGQSELSSSLVAGAEERVRGAVERAQAEIQRGIDAAARSAEERTGQPSPEANQAYYYQVTHPTSYAPSAAPPPPPTTPAQGSQFLYDLQHPGTATAGSGADAEARALARLRTPTPAVNIQSPIISGVQNALSRMWGGLGFGNPSPASGAVRTTLGSALGLGTAFQGSPTTTPVSTGPTVNPLDETFQRAQDAYENVVQNPEIRLPDQGFLSMRQANRIDPLLAYAMEQSGDQGWLTGLRPAEALGGYPEGGPGGQVDPVARDAFQQAMILAAKRLINQGYEITDPELQAALSGAGTSLYEPGSTLYDVAQRRQGEPDSREQARIAQEYEDQAAAAAQQAAEDRQRAIDDATPTPEEVIDIAESGQRQEFFDKYRVPMPTNAGPVASIYDVAFNDRQFQGIQQEVLARIQGGDTDIDAILDDLNVTDPLYRSMLSEMYGGSS